MKKFRLLILCLIMLTLSAVLVSCGSGESADVSKNPVAVYASGGFSDNCGYRYLPEYLYMRNRFWDKVLQRSAEDVLYAELITFALIDHSAAMVRWVKEFGLDSGTDILLRHVRDQLRTTRSWKQKAMLWWVGKHSLEPLLTGKAPSERVSKILKWLCIAGSLQKHSPYIHPQYYPHRSLGAAIKALLRNRLCS